MTRNTQVKVSFVEADTNNTDGDLSDHNDNNYILIPQDGHLVSLYVGKETEHWAELQNKILKIFLMSMVGGFKQGLELKTTLPFIS